MKHYLPVSQLIGREALPADIGVLGGISETIEDVLDRLLRGIRFKNLVINQSAFGDVRFYSLSIVTEELGFKLPGTDISLLFFPGSDGSGEANIPIAFEWRWVVKRYVNDFEAALFSRSPRDFFQLVLKVANISEAEFIDGIVRVFVGDPDPYVKLVQDIRTYVSDYKNHTATLQDAGGEILAKADDILTRLDALIIDLQDPAPAFDSAVDYIVGNFEDIAATLDVDLDLMQLAFDTVTRDVTDIDAKLEQLRILFGQWFGGLTWQSLEELLVPQFSLTVTDIPMALEFPRKWLLPIDPATNEPDPDEKVKSRLTYHVGSVTYSTRTGLTFAGENRFDFTKSMIGKTGLTLKIETARIDFSRTTNIPEANAAGYPVDFVGVFVKFIEIGLPKKWFSTPTGSPPATLAIVGRDLLIGTGGITGLIGLETLLLDGKPDPNGPLSAAGAEIEFVLGKKPPPGDARKGFRLGFSLFYMKFRHGTLLECKIKGSMTIPKFKASPPDPQDPDKPVKLGIELYIAQDGDFDVTATVPGGYAVEVPTIFIFKVKMLRVGKDDKRVFIQTSGDLSFANNQFLKSFIKEPLHIEKLRIYSDGSFEIEGGTIPLPESAKIKFGPATIAITAIHSGAHQQDYGGHLRKYRYWGFDGGISVNPGGVDARGDGIKYYYTVDDDETHLPHHHFLRIEGIGIDLVIPGNASKANAVLLLKGYLALKDPEYEGSLSFQLPKVKIAGGASMKYNTKAPAWIVDVFLELPKPIPLGSTSLGIYGFRGLFGLRYVASKDAIKLPPLAPDASWGDYYRAPTKGISLKKFMLPDQTGGARNPFSIGAGVSLATVADGGKAVTLQLFLLVSIPNLIMLEGRGDVLAKQRVGLTDDDPPYYAYLALSPDSIELGAGVHYMLPKSSGATLDLNVVFEAAFFFRNPRAWYVHFGTKAKPMSARVLSMFDAYAYLMLSASGIEAGTGVSFDFHKKYGPVSVSAHAYLDLWIYLSFERHQVGGGIALGGYVDVQFIGIGFHIEIATGLTVEAPKPFRIAGFVHVCVSINLRIKKISKCVDVEFVWERDKSVDLSPVPVLELSGAALPFAAGVHMGSGRSYEVDVAQHAPLAVGSISKIVPLDTYIDVKFTKPLDPSNVALIAGYTNPPSGNIEILPPKYGSRTVTHSYKLKAVGLKIWCQLSSTWIDYHPFVALSPGALLDTAAGSNLSAFPIGAWQKQEAGYSQIRFLALDPFTYMEPVGGYRPEEMGFDAATIFCAGHKRTETCTTFDIVHIGGAAPTWITFDPGKDYYRNGLLFRIEGEATTIYMVSAIQPPRPMLAVLPGSRAILQFPQPVVRFRLAFMSGAPSVTLRLQRRKPSAVQPAADPSATEIAYTPLEFVDVKELVVAPNALTNPFVYDDPDAPIDRVIVEPPAPDNRAIAALQEKIELQRDASPALRDLEALQQQLQAEQGKYCGGSSLGGTGSPTGSGATGSPTGFGRPPKGSECATYLYQVCWLAEEDWKFNQTIPGAAAVEADFQNMRQSIESTIAPIWHPNAAYAIELTVSDTVTGPDNAAVTHSETFYVHFKTGAALGHFVPDATIEPTEAPDGRQEIPERLLKFYIDMERTYPDPSGNLLYAKPLYYGAPVLRLFLAKPYAYHFFAAWPAYPSSAAAARLDPDHYEIEIRVKDPAESQPAADAAEHETPLVTAAATGEQTWLTDPAPRRTENLQVLANMRDPPADVVEPGTTCWQAGGGPIIPAAKGLQVELHDLEPDKLYTAVVMNRHGTTTIVDAEVHRYPFMTSRYRDFQSHIGSYRLTDDAGNQRPAVFLVSHDLADAATVPPIYAAARDILQRVGTAHSAAYPDFFDRLIHACLKLEPLSPALSLEFNFIRNGLTQDIYGLWIRSPEALNDPRIPQDQLRSAIRMYVGGSELLAPHILFSKDCCQAFVMTAAEPFPSQSVAFAFDYLIWNGEKFDVAATVRTDPFSAP